MRLFTAIPLPAEIKNQIVEATRNQLPVAFLDRTNWHLTLNFLGDASAAQLEEVKQAFTVAAKDEKSFVVNLTNAEQFRDQLHLKVKPERQLLQLQAKLQKAFEALGFQFRERAYYPHIKLVNLNGKVMNEKVAVNLKFNAEKVVLYESQLLPRHAKYITVAEQKL